MAKETLALEFSLRTESAAWWSSIGFEAEKL
jgi:hypothetical protein